MRNHTRRAALRRGLSLLPATALVGCSATDRRETATAAGQVEEVTVGAKNFVENKILAHATVNLLRATTDTGIVVEVPSGESRGNWQSLRSGSLDIYWEYTGTQYLFLDPQHETAPNDPQTLYEAVVRDAAGQGVRVFARAPFDNTFVLLAGESWQAETGVETLSEFAAHVNAGNTNIPMAVGEDFYSRPDGWEGLTDHYDFEREALAELDENIESVSIGITYELFESDETPVVMGFATDPQIAALDLSIIEDDRDFFPVYNPAPMVDASTIPADSAVGRQLDRLGPAFDGIETIRRLNGRVIFDGESPKHVADDFLRTAGLV